ncbi:MAG: 50S ribosomal protein L21e [Candidatus Pacearchaeota archaeon]
MGKRKKIKERGKIRFSEYFKELKIGDKVAIVRDKAIDSHFPHRIQGRTGVVDGKRGGSYIIKLKELSKEKIFIMPPIHLRKIKNINSKGQE